MRMCRKYNEENNCRPVAEDKRHTHTGILTLTRKTILEKCQFPC